MAAWLPQPVMFDSSHAFECGDFTDEQCDYYRDKWRNWYVADWTFALPTVAFFMCVIGTFIIGNTLTQVLALSQMTGSSAWRRAIAATRYLSYKGFRIESLNWNSAPVGILVLGLIGTVYFFCMDLVPSPYYWPGTDDVWGNSPPLGTRSGWLALACMPFLFATATKTNWITLLTGVTHEKLQIFHRWIAYAFFVLALMHTFPFIVWHIGNHDMVKQFTVSNIFEYWTGVVALLFQAWLTFASWGPFRSMGYEFFKAAHFSAVVVFVVIFFWHCAGTLTSWHYFVATAAIYIPCLSYPWLRTLFEYGVGQRAQVFVAENGFIRVTIRASFKWQTGQHCFLRFRGFGIHSLSSHPFTICSLPSMSPEQPSEIVFYIRCQRGFTARLYKLALKQPGVRVPVLVDGPYGGIDNQRFFDSDRIIVIAGGSGAGWILPFIDQFVRCLTLTEARGSMSKEEHQSTTSLDKPPLQRAARRLRSLRVILATRDIATRSWFHTVLDSLLSTHQRFGLPAEVSVEVHLTGEAQHLVQCTTDPSLDLEGSISSTSDRGDASKPAHHQVVEDGARGRPDLPLIIRDEALAATNAGQTVGVFVCGPLTMQDDVRNCVAAENFDIMKSGRPGGMYLHLEHFSWA